MTIEENFFGEINFGNSEFGINVCVWSAKAAGANDDDEDVWSSSSSDKRDWQIATNLI
jgi:hypothetical protein